MVALSNRGGKFLSPTVMYDVPDRYQRTMRRDRSWEMLMDDASAGTSTDAASGPFAVPTQAGRLTVASGRFVCNLEHRQHDTLRPLDRTKRLGRSLRNERNGSLLDFDHAGDAVTRATREQGGVETQLVRRGDL